MRLLAFTPRTFDRKIDLANDDLGNVSIHVMIRCKLFQLPSVSPQPLTRHISLPSQINFRAICCYESL